jgi:NTE family protein
VRALEAAGVQTVVFAPGAAEQAVMGDDMLSRHRLDEVIQQSFLAAGAYCARPGVAQLIRTAAVAGRR